MSNTRIEDEYSGIVRETPKKTAGAKYVARQYGASKNGGKCVRCPVGDKLDCIVVTKVKSDGTVYEKKLVHCQRCRDYFNGFNKQARDKKRGTV